MISRPNNWNEVQEYTERQKLSVGAYVCKVKKVAVQDLGQYGQQLCILFDIVEGEFSGFFTDEFKNNTMNDKKWKGVLRQWLPRNDGSEKDEWTKRSLKGLTNSFERSNPGFVWNWDEQQLVGKIIGIIFRNEEWDYNGKHGWTAKPFRGMDAEKVRKGEFTIPDDKPLQNSSAEPAYSAPVTDFSIIEDEDNQLPF